MTAKPQRSKSPRLYYLLLVIIVILTIVLARNCSSPTWHVSNAKAGGDTLNIAIELSPLGISTHGDTLSGYYYDMVCRMSQQHNRPVKIEAFTHLPTALDRLEKGRYDIVMGDIPANSDLRQRFIATNAVFIDRQVLVQLKDSLGQLRYPNQFSLTGDSIYVPQGSPFKTRLEHLTRELGDTLYIVEKENLSPEHLVIMVVLGQIPNAVVNSRMAAIMQEQYPMLDASVEISFSQFQSWLVNRNDSILCDTLNVWIDQMLK